MCIRDSVDAVHSSPKQDYTLPSSRSVLPTTAALVKQLTANKAASPSDDVESPSVQLDLTDKDNEKVVENLSKLVTEQLFQVNTMPNNKDTTGVNANIANLSPDEVETLKSLNAKLSQPTSDASDTTLTLNEDEIGLLSKLEKQRDLDAKKKNKDKSSPSTHSDQLGHSTDDSATADNEVKEEILAGKKTFNKIKQVEDAIDDLDNLTDTILAADPSSDDNIVITEQLKDSLSTILTRSNLPSKMTVLSVTAKRTSWIRSSRKSNLVNKIRLH